MIVAIVLQLLLPDQLSLRPVPSFLLPALEAALVVGLIIANPVRFERQVGRDQRWASLVLILLITPANARLGRAADPGDRGRAHGRQTAGPLLTSGAAIWITNVIAFALWYWEFDRGGPVHRAHGHASSTRTSCSRR